MPGRFLNLQPVASWKGREDSETQTRRPLEPQEDPACGIPVTRVLAPVPVALGGVQEGRRRLRVWVPPKQLAPGSITTGALHAPRCTYNDLRDGERHS